MMRFHCLDNPRPGGQHGYAFGHRDVHCVQGRLRDVRGDPAVGHLGKHEGEALGPGQAIERFFGAGGGRQEECDRDARGPHAASLRLTLETKKPDH